MARNLHQLVDLWKSKEVKKNELFAPGRMAYVVELEDDNDTGEIPTTLIRSKADVPMLDNESTLSTNDIVINKLTQILSYLRQGNKPNKKGKKYKDAGFDQIVGLNLALEVKNESIYDDIGEYVPTLTKSKSSKSSSGTSKKSYFVKPDEDIPIPEKSNAPRMPNVSELAGKKLSPNSNVFCLCLKFCLNELLIIFFCSNCRC